MIHGTVCLGRGKKSLGFVVLIMQETVESEVDPEGQQVVRHHPEPLLTQIPENRPQRGSTKFYISGSRPPWICRWIRLIRLLIDFVHNILTSSHIFLQSIMNAECKHVIIFTVKYENTMSSALTLLTVAVCEPECGVFQDRADHPSKWQHQETLHGPLSQLSAK